MIFIPEFHSQAAGILYKGAFIEIWSEGHHPPPKDIKQAPALKTELRRGSQSDSNTFCTLNPPVSLGVSRSEPIVGMNGSMGCSWDASSMQDE